MKPVYLADLADRTKDELWRHLVREYTAPAEDAKRFEILLAYESVGSWGCDSDSYFILREKKTRKLFTVHGSHCSCYGFENQWEPSEVTVKQLKAEKRPMCCGGYDNDRDGNDAVVKAFIQKLRGSK